MHPALEQGFIFWYILYGNASYMNIHFTIFAEKKIYKKIGHFPSLLTVLRHR